MIPPHAADTLAREKKTLMKKAREMEAQPEKNVRVFNQIINARIRDTD